MTTTYLDQRSQSPGRFFFLFCAIGCFTAFGAQAADPFYAGTGPNLLTPRSALVIGVGDYESLRPLGQNPVNDANRVADFLGAMGFGRIIRSINPRRNDILDKLDDLESTVTSNPGVMLVYYSGHGLSVNGNAYLAPLDARLRGPQDLADRMIPLQRIYDVFARAKPRQAIIIFDACRTDPFNGRNPISSETGLRAIEADPPLGMYIAFSTIDGRTASNGALDNSPFTTVFLQWAPKEEQISSVFVRVREALATSLIQQPSSSRDSFVGHFKFQMTRADFDMEASQFARVRENDIASLYDQFMKAYLSGYFYNTASDNYAKAREREALRASGALASPPPVSVAPPSPVVPTSAAPGTTKADVELRATSDLSSRSLATIVKGTPVVILGRTGDVFKIAVAGGGEGYISQTAVDVNPSLEQAKTIAVSANGALSSTAKADEAGTKAVWQNESVVVQATIPVGAASDKATIGLKATLDTVDVLRKAGVSMDKVVVSPTLRQGPDLSVKLLNLPAGRM